ncbi:type I-E CRISPR-associated protein Cas7/Cse4/CasC [Nocardia terpenica]|uniref:Type I-E CRISPR-associated protein Cas7/Cse4/CasC n=1 Tax=Nocardia terpenica TaxID=455432 RepID=A0A6G9Z0C9_9NOCA|nr:type I-E CRISPR-associated protein Cas7/Cse4/CasC [Nocardia terpenica]QIS18914.1 type I-E CRISPR-associated protein Cas7/Cse4/CasC [Nocardia terpenica]
MTRLFVDVHVLQTVPPSNINRDDTGSPKSAVYGGVPRARVSSQAWKRATRKMFQQLLDPATLGVRTKRVVELVAEAMDAIDPAVADRDAVAVEVLKAAGLKDLEKPKRSKKQPDAAGEQGQEQAKYLVFFSATQIQRLARLAVESARTGAVIDKAAARAAADTGHSVDVALFGRMIADAADLNVDAAAQVAHAISVHAVDTEFDYYTAVDDRVPEDNQGAGMIGLVEFNSSTLYRYATVNVEALQANLGDDTATVRAVETFLNAFVKSMPTGKQNTFANRTLPDAVVISLRTDQPVNLVTAFEEPVNAAGSARAVVAAKRLVERHQAIERSFGDGTTETFVVATGDGSGELGALAEPASFAAVVGAVTARVESALRARS